MQSMMSYTGTKWLHKSDYSFHHPMVILLVNFHKAKSLEYTYTFFPYLFQKLSHEKEIK